MVKQEVESMSMFDRNPGMVRPERAGAALRHFSAGVLESENVVPVVLEFEQAPVAVYKRQNPMADADKYQAELMAAHQAFLQQLASLGLDIQLGSSSLVQAEATGTTTMTMPHDFTHVFNGLGVLMPGRMVATVAQMAGVRAVTLNHERVYLNLDKSVPYIGAPKVWERADTAGRAMKGEGVVVAVIDTGIV
jgi:hypothetical protein